MPQLANNPTASAFKFSTALDANGNLIDTDWSKIIYRTGISSNHNINVSGGNEGTSYYFLLDILINKGLFKRMILSELVHLLNIDSKVTKSISIGEIIFLNEMNLWRLKFWITFWWCFFHWRFRSLAICIAFYISSI